MTVNVEIEMYFHQFIEADPSYKKSIDIRYMESGLDEGVPMLEYPANNWITVLLVPKRSMNSMLPAVSIGTSIAIVLKNEVEKTNAELSTKFILTCNKPRL